MSEPHHSAEAQPRGFTELTEITDIADITDIAGGGGLAAFSQLLVVLEQAEGTRARQEALVAYLQAASPADAAWAVWLLSGERLKRLIPLSTLKTAAMEVSGLPPWAFEECYQTVGDLAETIALLVGKAVQTTDHAGLTSMPQGLATWIEGPILSLRGRDPAHATAEIVAWWRQLPPHQIFCLNKLITGGLRVGVSRGMVAAALSVITGLSREVISTRLMQTLSRPPSAKGYQHLLMPASEKDLDEGPVPFFLAQSLTLPVEVLGHSELSQAFLADRLGDVTDWMVEWKWDGIRAQALVGAEGIQLWSRGEELVNAMFPELTEALADLFVCTGTACLLDGEILVWQTTMTDADPQDGRTDRPQPFSALQTRLGRKKPSAKLRAEAPAVFMAYDLLRKDGQDLRPQPFIDRRAALEDLLQQGDQQGHQQGHQPGHQATSIKKHLRLSSVFHPATWAEVLGLRARAGEAGTEGLMIKHHGAAYGQGRQKKTTQGECWKWKRDPMSVDAVLVYAQRGHGRRAGLYTDYGFALWDDRADPPTLVPFAKAYSGLTDAEMKQVDQVIRRTILEKFGPVRQVAPQLVMELGFEGVMASKRHKSGFAVRFPRILRLRMDKPVEQADRLSALAALLDQGG